MKLSCINFRCHKDFEVILKETSAQGSTLGLTHGSLTLLSGKNGVGKSTIFKAILYVLYGKLKKPYTFGEKSCKVVLEYENNDSSDLYVERTSRPNILKVIYNNVSYEDDAAQSVINEIILNYEQFKISSYVVQNMNSSILSCTPLEQLKFIQTLMQKNTEKDAKFKKDLKKQIVDLKQTKIGTESKIAYLERDLQQETDKSSNFEDLEDFDVENDSKEIDESFSFESIKEKADETKKKLNKSRRNLEQVEENIKRNKETTTKCDKLRAEINHIQTELEKNKKNKRKKLAQEVIDDLKTIISDQIRYQTRYEHKIQYDNMVKDYFEQIKSKKSALEKDKIITKEKLYKELVELTKNVTRSKEDIDSSVKELFSEIQANKTFKNGGRPVKKLKSLKTHLTRQLSSLDKKLQNARFLSFDLVCPSCSEEVHFYNSKLVKNDSKKSGDKGGKEGTHKSKSKEKDILRALKVGKEYLDRCNKYSQELEHSDNYKYVEKVKNHRLFIDEYNEYCKILEKKVVSSIILSYKKKHKSFRGADKFDKKVLESSKLSLKVFEKTMMENAIHEDNIESQQRKLSENQKKLEKYNKSIKKDDENASKKKKLVKDISRYTKRYEKYLRDLAKASELREKALRYKNYQDHILKLKLLTKEIEEHQNLLSEVVFEIELSYELEETRKQAEILAIESTLDSINSGAKIYLEKMFPDNEVIIELKNYKINKTNKNIKDQISTYVKHKGYVHDDISSLSGGERQKCNLVFLLAVNDILGSGVLLLDECLNNLDPEVHTEILLFLRETSSSGGRDIYVISHEAIHGVFDNVISI